MRSHSSRFCSRAAAIMPSDSGDGRREYCRVTVATSPSARYCSGGGGDVVDVAGAGGRDQHEQRPVEGAGPLHLGQRQVHPLARGRARCPARRTPAPARRAAGVPMTVSIDRSGTPAGRSGSGCGRTEASACRRPSRPRPAQDTRLPGPPLTVGGTHRSASPRLEHRHVGRRPGLDPLHRPVPQRGGAGTQPGEEAARGRPAATAPAARAAPRPAGGPARSASACSP